MHAENIVSDARATNKGSLYLRWINPISYYYEELLYFKIP